MQQRRGITRQRSYLGARVVYGRSRLSLDCVVRDLTENGARLVFGEPPAVRERFDLAIPNKAWQGQVTVAWRNDREIGVTFSPAAEPVDVPARVLQHVKQLERSNAQLRSRIEALCVSM